MDPATAKMALQLAAALGRSRALRYLVVGSVATALLGGLAVIFGPWMLTAQLAASMHQEQQRITDGGSCGAQGGVTGTATSNFTAEQVTNARIIWSVAQQMTLGSQGALVGIATALQESGLRNLPYGDRDSIGLFQQRAGWGSRAIRMNPAQSARLFFKALAKINGWQQMPVTVAAQTVQRSAFPDAYANQVKSAAGLVALIQSKTSPGSPDAQIILGSGICGVAGAATCPTTGLPVEAGLTPDALRVVRCLKRQWPQLRSFAGLGDRDRADHDHQDGRAIDAMIPDFESAGGRRLGAAISKWLVANHERLGVKYVIWNAHIWNVERAKDGWRSCGKQATCYTGPDDTAAHRDRVHVAVFGNQAGTSAVTGPVVLPVDQYVLTARFGQCSSHWANCHTGLDFAAPRGTPIRAVMSGKVIWTGWGGAYGNLTKIQNAGNVQTWYAHQSAIDAKVGQTVRAGQIVGRIGDTGNTTGPHLHLEVRVDGTPVDPGHWLTAQGVAP